MSGVLIPSPASPATHPDSSFQMRVVINVIAFGVVVALGIGAFSYSGSGLTGLIAAGVLFCVFLVTRIIR